MVTRSTRRICSVALCVLFGGTRLLAGEVDLSGHWTGAIKTPGHGLAIEIDFTGQPDSWSGHISIPLQKLNALPLESIVVGERITFAMAEHEAVPGTPRFSCVISEDGQTLAGDFTQAGQTFPFELHRGPSRVAAATAALVDFGDFVESARSAWKVPGCAIGIVVDGEIVFAQGFGQRDIENNKPVTTRTLFAIGSCSKAFTSFLLGTLADEGKLDWDRPVISYLPEFRLFDDYATVHITPRDLVTHRSGLPRHDLVWYNSSASRTELMERLRYLPPTRGLREQFQYNNLMFMAAGYLAGHLSGTTWEEAVQQRIFKPLGMTSSNVSVLDSQKASDYALPYREDDDVIKPIDFRVIDQVGPAGSINSNVEDMCKWLIVHLNDGEYDGQRIIKKATLEDMHMTHMAVVGLSDDQEFTPGGYGLGWSVDGYRGRYRVAHGGAIDGFIAQTTLLPRDRIGVVALANRDGVRFPQLMTLHALDRIFGVDVRDWSGEAFEETKAADDMTDEAEANKAVERKKDSRPAHALETYVGSYAHPGYGVIEITHDSTQLIMSYNDILTPFEHWHFEVFNGLENKDDPTFKDFKIRFLTDMAGEVGGISAIFEPTLDEEIQFARQADQRLTDPQYLARFVGDYQLGPQSIAVSLKGNSLTAYIAGQPEYILVPGNDDSFTLSGLNGFSIKFIDQEGMMVARFIQPNGVFDAQRKAAN